MPGGFGTVFERSNRMPWVVFFIASGRNAKRKPWPSIPDFYSLSSFHLIKENSRCHAVARRYMEHPILNKNGNPDHDEGNPRWLASGTATSIRFINRRERRGAFACKYDTWAAAGRCLVTALHIQRIRSCSLQKHSKNCLRSARAEKERWNKKNDENEKIGQ